MRLTRRPSTVKSSCFPGFDGVGTSDEGLVFSSSCTLASVYAFPCSLCECVCVFWAVISELFILLVFCLQFLSKVLPFLTAFSLRMSYGLHFYIIQSEVGFSA